MLDTFIVQFNQLTTSYLSKYLDVVVSTSTGDAAMDFRPWNRVDTTFVLTWNSTYIFPFGSVTRCSNSFRVVGLILLPESQGGVIRSRNWENAFCKTERSVIRLFVCWDKIYRFALLSYRNRLTKWWRCDLAGYQNNTNHRRLHAIFWWYRRNLQTQEPLHVGATLPFWHLESVLVGHSGIQSHCLPPL